VTIAPEDVQVGPSPIAGEGLFAARAIDQGEFLEYAGRVVKASALEGPNRYLFRLNGRLTVDGSDPSNLARYINHSCEPNCAADTKGGKVLIFVTKPLMPGEELTLDYGPEYFDQFIRPHGCRCSSCLYPKGEVSIGPGGLFVTMPSGLCIGVRWTQEQRQQLAAWFPTQRRGEE